ncbi:MAG: hypothetical protein IPL93_12665 [Actinomycetales bacterium]|nr:hypothetical protein [Actinomycetales bacterium]
MRSALLGEVQQLTLQLAGAFAGAVWGPTGGQVAVRPFRATDRAGRVVAALLLVLLGGERRVLVTAVVAGLAAARVERVESVQRVESVRAGSAGRAG